MPVALGAAPAAGALEAAEPAALVAEEITEPALSVADARALLREERTPLASDWREDRAELASETMEEVRLEASEAAELAAEEISEPTEEATDEAADEAAEAADEVKLLSLLLLSPEAEGATAEALAAAEVRMGRAAGVSEAVAATPAQRA